jgi:hypothetical protein
MKKVIFSSLLSLALLSGLFFTVPNDAKADCENYFVEMMIDGCKYRAEYTCDGIMVSLVPMEE